MFRRSAAPAWAQGKKVWIRKRAAAVLLLSVDVEKAKVLASGSVAQVDGKWVDEAAEAPTAASVGLHRIGDSQVLFTM